MQDKISNDGLYSYDIYVANSINIVKENLIGCNQKETLIILSLGKGEKKTPDSLLSFLKQILAAINFDIENDVFLLEVKQSNTIKVADLKKLAKIKYFINFGMPLHQLGFNLENDFLYRPFSLNGITFINANSLNAIQKNVTLKKHFWNCLKATFLN